MKILKEILEIEEMKNCMIMCIFSLIIVLPLLIMTLFVSKSIPAESVVIIFSFIFVIFIVFKDCSIHYISLKNLEENKK